MMDDSETVEDREKGSVTEVTDDSCTVEFIEIVPLDRASDDYHKLEFIDPVAVISPEDLQDLKQEMTDGYMSEGDGSYSVKQEPADETPGCLQHVSYCYFHVCYFRYGTLMRKTTSPCLYQYDMVKLCPGGLLQ